MGGLLSKNERGDYHQWHISPPEQWQAQRPAPSSQKPPNSSPPSNYPSSERNIPPSQDRREWAPAVPRSKPSTDSSLSRETETVYFDANSFAEDTPLSPPGRQLSDPSGKDRPTLTSGAPTNVKDIHQAKSASRGTIETNVNSPSRNPGDVRASKAPKPRGHPSVPPPQVSLIGAISRVHYPNENVATGTPVHGADHAETHIPDTALNGPRTDVVNTPAQEAPQDPQSLINRHQPGILKKIYYISRFRLQVRAGGSSPSLQRSSSVMSLPAFTSSGASRPTEIHRENPHSPEPPRQKVKRCVSLRELRKGLLSPNGTRSENFNALDLTGQLLGRTEVKGSGGFCDVWQARLGSRLVAVKALRATEMSPSDDCRMRKRLGREIYVWAGLDHRYVLELLGFAFVDGRSCLISPWCENGTLQEYLLKHNDVNRPPLVRQVAEGLHYLHMQTPPIVHGDFKTTNVLVTEDGVAKIGDFGGAKRLGETNTGLTTAGLFQATVAYTAPEIIRDGINQTLQSDVYAFALVALEIMTSRRPFWRIQSQVTLISKIVFEKQTPSEEDYPELQDGFLWKLLRRCWSYDPQYRPEMIEVCHELASARYGPNAAVY